MRPTCEEIRLEMADGLTGRLDARESAALEAHLNECPACRAHQQRLSRTAGLLSAAYPKPVDRDQLWAKVERSLVPCPPPHAGEGRDEQRESGERGPSSIQTPSPGIRASHFRLRGVAATAGQACPPSPVEGMDRRHPTHTWICWFLAAAAAVLLVCAILFNRQSQMPTAPQNTHVAQQPVPVPEQIKETLQAPAVKDIANTPTTNPAPRNALAPTRERADVPVPPKQPDREGGSEANAGRGGPTEQKTSAPTVEPEVVQIEMPDWEEEFVGLPAPLDERSAPAVAQEARAPGQTGTSAPHVTPPANPPKAPDIQVAHTDRPAREPISDAQGLAVLRRTGALVVYEPEQRIWRTVQSGEAIPYGARLRTGAGAQAELAFGESRLWLDSASDLIVARAADGSRRAALEHGRLRIDLLRPDAGFSIEAGGGVVELTGTIVEVESAAPQLAFVRTLEGHARVMSVGTQGAGEPIQVSAGEEALLAVPGEEPLAALPAAFRERVKELTDAPDRRLAFKPATDDWTKDLKKPAPKSRAVGQLIVKDAAGRPAEPLHIARLSVEARIRGAAALTRVDQSFRNDTDGTLEGTFYFPLPPGAALSRFAMYVDNEQKTLIEGEVVEREYARNVYESILRQKRDPALVEWMEGNLFKARIFPIPPRSLKRVILEYTQLLPATFDTRRYVFPLVSELTRKTPIDAFSLHAVLETGDGTPFRRIESPSYPMTDVTGQGQRVATATLALRNLRPEADFVLAISAPRRGEIVGEVYGESDESPYLLLGYQPRPVSPTSPSAATPNSREPALQARDILFVVETSGARNSADLDTQSQVLRAVLAGLNPARDRVALAAADVGFVPLTPGWVNLYAGQMAEAQAALDRRAPLGALDLENVLSGAADFAARNRDGQRQQLVVFIGSGVPALGTLDAAALTDCVATKFFALCARFAGFAVGRTVDTLVLSALARRTNGLYLPLKGDEDLIETAFLAALSLQTPWVEAPALSAEGVTLADVRPDGLGSVLPGQEVFLHARLQGRPRSFDVSVAGQLNGKPYASRATVRLPLKLNANPAVGRFWARAHLDHLLARPQTSQIQQEVVRLAKTWTLMTPYTSFLVLESEQDYVRYEIKREQRRRIWREDADIFSEPEKEDTTALSPPAGETPEQRADRLLREARQLTTVQDQARLDEAKAELEAGERLFKNMVYAEAKKHFERSATMDPTNLGAQEYLRKADAMLGIRYDQFHERLAQLEQNERVRIQEQVAVLTTALQDGDHLEARGETIDSAVADSGKEQILADQLDNLRSAELRYRRVKEILNYMPQNFDMPNERRVVDESIQRVRGKIAAKEDEVSFLRRQEAARIATEQGLRETLLFKQRIQKLGDEVKALQWRGEYRSAEKLAIRILQLDPLNQEAEAMKRQARAAQHEQYEKEQQALRQSGSANLPTNSSQAQAHLDAGERLLKAFEYRAAYAELLRAVNLDQANENARELLVEVNDILNKRQDRIQSAVQSLAHPQKVAVQERLITLDARLDWGNRFVAQAESDPELPLVERIRRYHQAQDAFERARELIKWMPVGVNVSEQQHQAERMIGEVRKATKALEVQLAEEDKQSAMELSVSRATQELEQEQRRVAVQLDEVKALFEIGDYERAEMLAGRILETDPTNAEAHAVQITARDRKHIKKQRWITEEYAEQYKQQQELADNNHIPHEDYLVYPDNWADIAQRTGRGPDGDDRRTEAPAPGFTKTPPDTTSATFGTVGSIVGGEPQVNALSPTRERADVSEANAGRGGRTESTVSKEELETLKREVEELRARIGADRATSKEAGKDWQVETGYSLNDSIWKGTVLNDQDVKNRYGPDATVETKQGKQTIGGLAQVWYYGDELSRRLIEKGQVQRNGDGTVTVLLDEEVSGDSWDPVIRKMPEAEYEALRRKAEQDRYTAGLNYYIRGENAKASSPAFDTRRDELNRKMNGLRDEMMKLRTRQDTTKEVSAEEERNLAAQVQDIQRREFELKREIRELGKEAGTQNSEAWDSNHIPYGDLLVYPSNWAEIAQRGGVTGKARTDEPWKTEILRKLSRRVSFDFHDTPLQEALTFIQTLAKVSVILDPPAVTTGTAQLKITLRVTDMDMETALKWILRLAELDYDLRNQAIFISTRERLNADPQVPQHSGPVPGVPQKDPKDPPAPPASEGGKADEKKDPAEATAKARKLLQEALAALPRTDETARQRLRLFAELASLSTGAEVYRVLNDGIENLGGEGPFAEALATLFLQTIGKEKDATALESALAFTSDPALRANLAVRGGELTTDVEHRLALFARAYRESPSFLRTYVWQLVKAEKNKEAIALLEEALRNGSAEAWIVPQLNELYGRTHDDAGLLRVLTQAVAQRPREAQGRLQLARALDKMGRGPEALRELKLAREFRPEDLPTHREYLALAEKLQDRAAIEDALWGLLDHDWPGDRSVWDDAQKRWKKLADEYRDAGQDAKAKELKEKLACLKALDLVVRLTWDTDGTDVDLHVTEPSGHQTFYSAMQSRSGNLDRDVRSGYGPETYMARRAAKGTYRIAVNYFSGGKKTKATVTVIRHKDCAEEVTQKFEVQLENKGETAKVLEFEWE